MNKYLYLHISIKCRKFIWDLGHKSMVVSWIYLPMYLPFTINKTLLSVQAIITISKNDMLVRLYLGCTKDEWPQNKSVEVGRCSSITWYASSSSLWQMCFKTVFAGFKKKTAITHFEALESVLNYNRADFNFYC